MYIQIAKHIIIMHLLFSGVFAMHIFCKSVDTPAQATETVGNNQVKFTNENAIIQMDNDEKETKKKLSTWSEMIFEFPHTRMLTSRTTRQTINGKETA